MQEMTGGINTYEVSELQAPRGTYLGRAVITDLAAEDGQEQEALKVADKGSMLTSMPSH